MARDDASDTDLGRRAARPGRPPSQVEAGGPSPSGGLGIALNGGGLRAPIVASGFLRGLHHIGVLEKASHVSGISGGSIAAAIVSYSPTDLNDLLAMDRLPSPPGSIPDYQNGQGKLGEIGEKALHRVLVGPALKQSAASNLPSLAGSVCCGGVPAAMRTALNEAILAPHGVDGTKPPAAQSDAREGVTATIPGRPEPIISFCMASPEWPDNLSHIERVRRANAATLGRLGINSDGEKYSLEEVVEAARAERAAVAGASAVMFDLGGSSVGTHAGEVSMEVQYCCVLSRQLTVRPGRVRADEFNRDPLTCCSPRALVSSLLGLPEGDGSFTVAHAVAASSDYASINFAHTAPRLSCLVPCWRRFVLNRGLNMPMSVPEPLLERRGPCGGGAGGQTPMAFTDGGQLDTSAVLPLLARGVRRIISMQTGGTPYRTLKQCGGDLTEGVESGLMALFGVFAKGQMREMIVTQAAVFAVETYREMRRQFDACKAEGRPLVALLKGVPVHANPFHGVRGGWAVDLCIWYIDAPRSWLEAVPQTAEVIKPVESEVPIIPAFGLLDNEAVNMVCDLAAWSVISSERAFLSLLEGGADGGEGGTGRAAGPAPEKMDRCR